MSDGSENEDVPDEILIALAEFRAQTYDSLAANALTIVSIQLIVLPLSVSALSLLFQLDIGDVSPSNNSSASVFIQNDDDIGILFSNLMIVFFVLTVATGLAVNSYREARSKSYSSYNFVRDIYPMETNQETDFSHLDGLLQTSAEATYAKYHLVSERINEISKKVWPGVKISERDQLLAEFGRDFSDESSLRLQLVFSLFLTFVALILLLRTLLAPVFDQTDIIIVFIVVFVILGLFYVYIGRAFFPIIAAFVQNPVKHSLAVLFFLYGFVYASYLFGKSSVQYIVSQGEEFMIGTALLTYYFLSLLIGTLLRDSLFQDDSYAAFVAISLFTGLSGIGYLISSKLNL